MYLSSNYLNLLNTSIVSEIMWKLLLLFCEKDNLEKLYYWIFLKYIFQNNLNKTCWFKEHTPSEKSIL